MQARVCFEDVEAAVRERDGDVILRFDDDRLILQDTRFAQLDAGDFIF